MNLLGRIFSCILLTCLWGCSSQHALRGQEIAQCRVTCMEHFKFCSQNCMDNCPNCSWASTMHSKMSLAKYVNERKIEGKKVMRELNSYRDPLKCRKVTCDCVADLKICKQSCSGVIPKRLRAVPNCV